MSEPQRAKSNVLLRVLRPLFGSLRVRVIGLVVLALLPAFALMVFNASESRRQAIEYAQYNAVRLTELAASNQQQLIDGARDILITLAQLPAIQSQDRAACLFFLSNVLMLHPLYANFGAADASGEIFCMTLPQRMPINIARQDYFKQSMSNRDFAISEYQISATNSQAVITLAYPVLDPYMGILFGWKAFVAAILGGRGSIMGATLAGFLLGFIEIFVAMIFPSTLRDLIAYSIVLIILTFRPHGFFGEPHSARLRL